MQNAFWRSNIRKRVYKIEEKIVCISRREIIKWQTNRAKNRPNYPLGEKKKRFRAKSKQQFNQQNCKNVNGTCEREQIQWRLSNFLRDAFPSKIEISSCRKNPSLG